MIALSKRLANYFLNRLPEDSVCHWDLALVGTDALRDSSSAAIAVCGLLELVKHLPVTDPDRALSGVGERDHVVADEALSDGQRREGQWAAEALGVSPGEQ